MPAPTMHTSALASAARGDLRIGAEVVYQTDSRALDDACIVVSGGMQPTFSASGLSMPDEVITFLMSVSDYVGSGVRASQTNDCSE
jgi:hypothetical protein